VDNKGKTAKDVTEDERTKALMEKYENSNTNRDSNVSKGMAGYLSMCAEDEEEDEDDKSISSKHFIKGPLSKSKSTHIIAKRSQSPAFNRIRNSFKKANKFSSVQRMMSLN
jgi:hypothetical protein